jgi:hypothetical protein
MKKVHSMKRNLPYIFSLTLLTVLTNIALVVDYIRENYTKEADFMNMVVALLFISSMLFFICKAIYTQQVTRGEKSVKKLALIILFLCWVDLLFVSLAFIEGIHAEQNPITNESVVYSWIVISIIVTAVHYFEKRYGKLKRE